MATNSRTTQLDAMYASTWQLRWKKIHDQVMTSTPFYYWMTKQGSVRSENGGAYIEEPLNYAKNSSIQGIGRGGVVDLQREETLTTSKWDWKYQTGHVTRLSADDQKNKGKSALINQVNHDLDLLRNSHIQKMEEWLFGDGTGDGSTVPHGLQQLFLATPTTVSIGGIDRASYDWWRNQTLTMSGLSMAVYLRAKMLNLFNTCGQFAAPTNERFPNILLTTQAVHEAWEEQLTEITSIPIRDKGMADLGYGELAYKGRPMIWSPQCPTGVMYMLNTSAMSFVKDSSMFMKMLPWQSITNQPGDRVAHMLSACNLTVGNMSRHGVLHTITTA